MTPIQAATGPLRIAYVTETWPPEVNGVAMSAARLVDTLLQRGHSIQLLRPSQGAGDLPTPQDRLETVLCRGAALPLYPSLRLGWAAPARLEALWRAWRPQAVHVATEGPLGWAALRAARRLELPVTSDFRTNFHAYSRHYGLGPLRPLLLAGLRSFHNRCQATTVPTEALCRELAGQGFERLQVIGRGVDTGLYHPTRRSHALRSTWGVGPDDLVLAYVGRLAAEKNLDLLVQVAEAVQRVKPGSRLLLVGDGPRRAELQQHFPQALFAGHRSGVDLAAHYASADLFLFPSLTETFGNVVTEAMASGLPVLAFDCAAAGQLITRGEDGQLVPPGQDSEFLRQALLLALQGQQRRSLGERASATVAELGWPGIARRFERMLETLPVRPGQAPQVQVDEAPQPRAAALPSQP